MTVSVARLDVAVPQPLVKTARYCLPLSVAAVVNEYVVDVAPAMLLKFVPSLDTCHCTVGTGVPLAAAVNVAVDPAHALALAGCVVIDGAVVTVSVAAVDVALPQLSVNTAR